MEEVFTKDQGSEARLRFPSLGVLEQEVDALGYLALKAVDSQIYPSQT